jgi:hypothetical protein
MSSGYVKIYGSILDSSVWAEPPATRCVWLALLAMADESGFVEASVGGLARRANVTPKQCETALAALLAPDPDSKSPAHEGRRIERIERGWAILNYRVYREMRSPKQVADAERQQAWRERQKAERDMSQESQQVAATVDEAVAVTAVTTKDPSTAAEPKIRRVPTPGEDRLAVKLLSDADRLALTAICAKAPNPVAWVAEMDARLTGMHLPMLTAEQLGAAIREYVGDGHLERPSFRHFCGYLTNTRQTRADRPGRTAAQRTAINGAEALKDIA